MVYNGEAYNAEDLRNELLAVGCKFRGHSDTEVILEGCAYWGVGGTLERLNAMFAFALWDRSTRTLVLARDRLGIKPLYWSSTGNTFLFGSELKALRDHPACPTELDRGAIAAFLRHNYVPAPHTALAGVHKLRPGRMLTIRNDGSVDEAGFWDFDSVVESGRSHPFAASDEEATEALESLLGDAVRRQMVSDVPLGVFLSGGVDSSLICALMQAHSDRPVRSFSIGFVEEDYSEARHAAAVAAHLGTAHTELYVTPKEARDVIPLLPDYYDEPFADSSQIPTYLLSKLTRQHVTVALSGDGGDELFAGYTRYLTAAKIGKYLECIPVPVRSLGAKGLRALRPTAWQVLFHAVPRSLRPAHPSDRIYKFADILTEDAGGFYRRLISHWWEPERLVPGSSEPLGPVWDRSLQGRFASSVDWMQYLDVLTYLPDDILTKVDRASMAVSLETRVPLLDHRVVEFAFGLPAHMKIRGGISKWLLRQVLYRHVPRVLVDRPKMGFGVPIGAWLRGPLRDWAEELLSSASLNRYGLLKTAPVRERWQEHLSGQRNWQYHLWDILMLQAWCARWQ